MSRFWANKSYWVGLHTDRIEIIEAKSRFGLKPTFAATVQRLPTYHHDADIAGWTEYVGQVLANAGVGSGSVRMVLANAFVRYFVLPWQSTLYSREEWLAYAVARHREVYGDTGGWECQYENAPYGNNRLAAAMPKALLLPLLARFRDLGLSMESLVPHLSAARRSARSPRGKAIALQALIAASGGKIALVRMERGALQSLTVSNVSDQIEATYNECGRLLVAAGIGTGAPVAVLGMPVPAVLRFGAATFACHSYEPPPVQRPFDMGDVTLTLAMLGEK